MKDNALYFLMVLVLIQLSLTLISVNTRSIADSLDRIAVAQEAGR